MLSPRSAFHHVAVDGNAFARAYDHRVARNHAFQIDFLDDPIALDLCAPGLQLEEFLDGGRRSSFGARFEQFAHQHQRDDGGTGFEIDMKVVHAKSGYDGTEQVSHAGAQCNQHVHVGGSTSERIPGARVETTADPELHRRCQKPLQRARQNFAVVSGEHCSHLQHERQRQGRRNPEHPEFTAVNFCVTQLFLFARYPGQFPCVVTGFAHGCDQGGHIGRAARKADVRVLGREVDRCFNTGELAQGFLDSCRAGGASHAVDRQIHFDEDDRVHAAKLIPGWGTGQVPYRGILRECGGTFVPQSGHVFSSTMSLKCSSASGLASASMFFTGLP